MYIVINGGGKVGEYLATVLLQSGNEVAVIDTYVYSSMRSLGYSYSTAIGLFQSVMGLVLVTLCNKLAKKINDGEGLF